MGATPLSRQVLFHVGAPKCGSTSIQRFLSENPLLAVGNKKYVYAAINHRGELQYGEVLKHAAEQQLTGEIHTAALVRNGDTFEDAFRSLLRATDEDQIIVMSSENWLDEHNRFSDLDLFNKVGVQVRILLVIRPQIDWINSGWWQWGVWEGESFEDWARGEMHTCNWERLVESWQSVPGVDEVVLFDATANTVVQLAALLGVEIDSDIYENIASPPALIDFLLRHREFGRVTHDAEVEYRLAKLLGRPQRPSPFIVSTEMQDYIIEETAEANKRLAKYFENAEDKERYLQNDRYFRADSYRSREITDPVNFATADDYAHMIAGLMADLLNAEKPFDPSEFDPERYLELNPDVKNAGENPFAHYMRHGFKEGRRYT